MGRGFGVLEGEANAVAQIGDRKAARGRGSHLGKITSIAHHIGAETAKGADDKQIFGKVEIGDHVNIAV